MKPVILMITLLIFPAYAQATELVSPVLMLINWVYETTHVLTAMVVACGIWLLVLHMKNSTKEES